MKKFTITLALLLVVGSILSLQAQEMRFSADSVIATGHTPLSIVCADFDADSSFRYWQSRLMKIQNLIRLLFTLMMGQEKCINRCGFHVFKYKRT